MTKLRFVSMILIYLELRNSYQYSIVYVLVLVFRLTIKFVSHKIYGGISVFYRKCFIYMI